MEGQPVILIVDDEPIIRDTLDALLGDDYHLLMAKNGVEGFAMALQHQPDVILLDVMMPEIDGITVCKQIRATQIVAEIPIIMITALDDRDSRLRALSAGVDDFLTKPFDSIELMARIQTITRLNRYRRLLEQRDQIAKMHEELLISYHKTIEGWSTALDLRDKETEGHTLRVTEKSVEFARAINISEENLEHIRLGALLHDVGKLAIPDSILLKPSELTEEERQIMRQHPQYAYEWLSSIPFLSQALDIPYCHHERWDGSGYPQGLRGKEIPIFARIFSIVDVWDALSVERSYRAAMPEDEIRAYLINEKGKAFDPELVDLFLEWCT